MAKQRKRTPPPTPEEAIARYAVLDNAVRNFGGLFDELESAIGMYVLGHHVGWKVLYFVHSKRTIRKYEEILGIKITEEFPPEGPDADRAMAYAAIKRVSNFWKAVSGEEKIELTREDRRSIE